MAVLWHSEAAEESTETHVDGPQSPASTESPGPSMYYTFSGELWQYDGEAPLGFVTLPAAKDIRAKHGPSATPVGAINVLVTVGATHWATSLFSARSHRCYVLPIQKSVRAAELLVARFPCGGTARAALSRGLSPDSDR
jgi:hypothetical protein